MKTPFSKPDELLIDEQVCALRSFEVAAPDAFVARALHPLPRRSITPLRLALAAVGVAVVAGVFIMSPSTSVAATLERIVTAADNASNVVWKQWNVAQDGTRELIMEVRRDSSGRVLRNELRNHHHVLFEGNRVVRYHEGDPFAVVGVSNPAIYGDLFPDTSRMLHGESVKRLAVERGIRLDGHAADRYTLFHEFIDGAGQHQAFESTLWVDPSTGRPMRSEVAPGSILDRQGGTHPGSVTEWQYPARPPALTLPLPPGTRLYDLVAQRDSLKRDVAGEKGLGTQKVGRASVKLCAVVVDEVGFVEAIVSGSAGRPGRDPRHLRVDGREDTRGTVGTTSNGGSFIGSAFVYGPLSYRGKLIVSEQGRFSGLVPGRALLVEIPIWTETSASHSPTRRRFEGYASFRVAAPLWTSSLHTLHAPSNRSIFNEDDAPVTGARATRVEDR